ncbi:MAG: feoB2 [Ignavibacteria bacterium]|nr:feoB2 [Ignavibacteria bacterium]
MIKRIVLVGQPNVGKSTLFNTISDSRATTANFPGTTNEILRKKFNIFGTDFDLVDLPGSYSLNPSDVSESITIKYLISEKIDLIINVIDSSQLARGLELTVELAELGLPMLICLNLIDECAKQGIRIDEEKLSEYFGCPVVSTSALFGKGIKKLVDTAYDLLQISSPALKILNYSYNTEKYVTDLEKKLANVTFETNGNKRFFAIKAIENPNLLSPEILNKLSEEKKIIQEEIQKIHRTDSYEVLSSERHHLAMKICEKISVVGKSRRQPGIDKFDTFLLKPPTSYFFLGLFFVIYFLFIFYVGNLLSSLADAPLNYLSDTILTRIENQSFWWHTANGALMGLKGLVGIVLPYFLPLVFLTSLLEETGYLSRVAFLTDGLFHLVGLHGKSVVSFILGFGCSIPALYSTRMLENKRDRLIAGILIPFIPCSARIAVIFALAAAFTGPIWAAIVFIYVIIIIGIIGKILSRILSNPTGLILEIPNLRLPSPKASIRKTYYKLAEFFKDTTLFLMLGSITLGWIEYLNVSAYINMIFSPIIKYVLGLPEQLGSTLVYGFLRKELILVMITQAMGKSSIAELPLSANQIIVFVIFVTLYFPCFTTFIVVMREFKLKTAVLSALLSITIATVSAFLFKILI